MDSVYLYDKYGSPISHDVWTQRRAAHRLGVRELARARRGHLGGARRAAGVPLLARDVLGGGRSRHPPRQQALVPGAARALARGARRDLPATSSRASGMPSAQAFVQHAGATTLDAAALLMPLVRFISPTDPRWLSTLRAIERELVSDSLVYRYRLGDAVLRRAHGPGGHVLDVLVLVRRVPVAHGRPAQGALLLREDARLRQPPRASTARSSGPQAQHLGNFPQAFTHLALISAAYDLDRRLSAAGHAG